MIPTHHLDSHRRTAPFAAFIVFLALGATGAWEAALSLLSIERGVLPRSVNSDDADCEVAVTQERVEQPVAGVRDQRQRCRSQASPGRLVRSESPGQSSNNG